MSDTGWRYPGARWWKFDFHTHTPASQDTIWFQDPGSRPTPEQWLLKYMAAEIDCVAVTDHNTGEWIDKLRDAYKQLEQESPPGFRQLYLFPGVELSVQGGVHLLAIFDLDKGTADITELLGAVGFDGTRGATDGVTRRSLVEVLEIVEKRGGIAIPAHADQPKGLLHLKDRNSGQSVLDSTTLSQILESGRILAMEWIDPNTPKPQSYGDLKLNWTEVLGSDCENFRGLHPPGSRFTWVKMGRPSLEGLRLALHDGAGLSIHRSDQPGLQDPNRIPDHLIEAVEIREARYMGRGQPTQLQFNPWFNALVGGRGTGKSTVVHALRLAYRREPELLKRLSENDPVRKTFESFIKEPSGRHDPEGALDYRSLRRTEILVTLKTDSLRRRLRWRQDANGPAVEEETASGWAPDASEAITSERFPVRIFSQGQIASLASENQLALLGLVDEAARLRDAKDRLEQERKGFFALRARLRENAAKLKRLPEVRGELADVERKLAIFEKGQHAQVLKEYQLRQRQNREIDRQLEDTAELAAEVRRQAEALVLADLPAGLFESTLEYDREALEIVDSVRRAVEAASRGLEEIARGLEDAVTQARQRMHASGWFARSMEAAARYRELAAQLEQQGVSDPGQYGRLVQDRQRLADEVARLEELEKRQQELRLECEQQRRRVGEMRREITRRRRQFLEETLRANLYVRMTLIPYGDDPRAIEQELREVLEVPDGRFESDILTMTGDRPTGGIVARLLDALPDEPAARTREFETRLDSLIERIERSATGSGDFGGHFNNYLSRAAEKNPELIDKVLVWFPEDALRVEYSPKGDGQEFRSILQASAGQRAAAMLAFLLAYGDEPLVLDQPEDDLDNHLIYELVVRQIRDNKLRRQLIIVTHNPNIVVNGDAELVHALDFARGQCRVVHSGCLQEREVREEVCRVMEGGREAFERRYLRIGKEI